MYIDTANQDLSNTLQESCKESTQERKIDQSVAWNSNILHTKLLLYYLRHLPDSSKKLRRKHKQRNPISMTNKERKKNIIRKKQKQRQYLDEMNFKRLLELTESDEILKQQSLLNKDHSVSTNTLDKFHAQVSNKTTLIFSPFLFIYNKIKQIVNRCQISKQEPKPIQVCRQSGGSDNTRKDSCSSPFYKKLRTNSYKQNDSLTQEDIDADFELEEDYVIEDKYFTNYPAEDDITFDENYIKSLENQILI